MGLLYDVCNIENAIPPDELEERLLTIRETARTKVERKYQMHTLVIELLTDLGYEVGAEIYAETVIER